MLSYKNYNNIGGLYYIPNYISKKRVKKLEDKINAEIQLQPISNNNNSRRVAHYGYTYSYDRSGLNKAPEIPIFLKEIIIPEKLEYLNDPDLNQFVNNYDQVIINEYKPGQKINYHIDHTSMFGKVIICLTIGECVPIKFKKDNIVKTIYPEKGSLYIMTGRSRYQWKHYSENNTNGVRYSITYRSVIQKIDK